MYMGELRVDQILGKAKFLRNLPEKGLTRIAETCQIRNYEAGEFIFRQGDFGEHLYIIIDGRVYLERSVDLGVRQGKVVIDTLGKGRTLGCWSTLLGEPHTLMSSACCQEPTRVVFFKGEDVRGLMIDDTELGFHIMERLCFLLSDRIRAAYGAMEKL